MYVGRFRGQFCLGALYFEDVWSWWFSAWIARKIAVRLVLDRSSGHRTLFFCSRRKERLPKMNLVIPCWRPGPLHSPIRVPGSSFPSKLNRSCRYVYVGMGLECVPVFSPRVASAFSHAKSDDRTQCAKWYVLAQQGRFMGTAPTMNVAGRSDLYEPSVSTCSMG